MNRTARPLARSIWCRRNARVRFLHAAGLPITQKQVCRYANARKPCSCWMCGNARAVEGPTKQERQDWE